MEAIELERGRDAVARRAWRLAYESLSRADDALPLGAEELELLATSAYMLGRDHDYLRALERAHRAHLQAGDTIWAARCGLWLAITLILRGEIGAGSGWMGRARRLVEREERDCAERGYLLIPLIFQHEAAGDYGAAAAVAADAAAIGERLGDRDLFALAVQSQGNLLVLDGSAARGLGLLDEAMVAVTTGELSPIASGLVYCGVILGCQAAFAPARAREWTAALAQWCEQQPDMVAFTGRCLTHRAEIMYLHGGWPEALEEARRAGVRCEQSRNPSAGGEAVYLEGEIQRLRGDHDAADMAYRKAGRWGREPQPGLALLRLAQGNTDASASAIRRALDETAESPLRARLLPACVEILLVAGEVADARAACEELERIAEGYESEMLGAMAAHARGAVSLAEGEPRAALPALRRAAQQWQVLQAPYEAARARALVSQACRALGDHDAAAFELEAARGVFAGLGAAPDLTRVESLIHVAGAGDAHGLTARELEVLRLVAAGKSNRAIAADLVLSEHTVARHLQNIFAKLRVSSRTAAGAFAFEHGLA